jgi:hypothetical protein
MPDPNNPDPSASIENIEAALTEKEVKEKIAEAEKAITGSLTDEQKAINKAATANEETAVNEDEVGTSETLPGPPGVLVGDGSGETLPEINEDDEIVVSLDTLEPALDTEGKLPEVDAKVAEANAASAAANKLIEEGRTEEAEEKLGKAQAALAEADRLMTEADEISVSWESAVLICPRCGARKTIFRKDWTGATRCITCGTTLTGEHQRPE